MLEDFTGMEKKPNGRTLQVPTKSGTEVKNLDTNNSKSFGKYNRRKEPASTSSSKNEPTRKYNNGAKNGKYADKQPRPRSQYYGCGKSSSKVDLQDYDPEYGSVFKPGNKKQNLNHLLGFTLAPRSSVSPSGGSGYQREKNGNWLTTHKHKYNKEQFLQANCQFVVKSGIDYSPYMVDPDILVDWNLIEQVWLSSTEEISCPICLDKPGAAKMTRCGHVYCCPCVLHYLALSDKTWRKCPICYEAVHRKDLKSVVVVKNSPSRVGEEVSLRLMKRDRGSLLAIPASEDEDHRDTAIPLSIDEKTFNIAYSKLLLASPTEVHSMLEKERAELQDMLAASQGEPEVCFVEQAIELLSEREKKLNTGESNVEEKGSIDGKSLTDDSQSVDKSSFEEENTSEDDFSLHNVSPEDIETENQVSGHKPFYFYQALDGQNVFLNSLNLKMLEMQYGSLQDCPYTITGHVLEKEEGAMTRELRNRLKAVSHLPITATFELLELDMRELVDQTVYEAFAPSLASRAQRRRERKRKESKNEKKIAHDVAVLWGQSPSPRIRLDSTKHFPKCGEEDQVEEQVSPAGSVGGSRGQSPSVNASLDERTALTPTQTQAETAGPSFAQIIKRGSTSSKPRPSWPTLKQADVISNEDPDEYAAPRFQNNISEFVAQALEQADLNPGAEDDSSRRKKKKKRKQRVLLATGMVFSGKQ